MQATIQEAIYQFVGPRCDTYYNADPCRHAGCSVWREYDRLIANQKDKPPHPQEARMQRITAAISGLPIEDQFAIIRPIVRDDPSVLLTKALTVYAKHHAKDIVSLADRETAERAEADSYYVKRTWTPDEQQLKAIREFNVDYPLPSGPGRGKSDIIKDLDFLKNRVQPVKLKRVRKRDLKGFIKKEE